MKSAFLVAVCLMSGGLLSGCSCSSSTVLVNLRTNLVPGVEFDLVRSELTPRAGGDAHVATSAARFGDSVERGMRVAQIDGLATGSYDLRLTLMHGTDTVIARPVVAEVQGNLSITVIVTRDCRTVSCTPGEACYAGQCVPIGCDQDPTLTGCPPARCTGASTCHAAVACAVSECINGACVAFGDDGLCGANFYCDPDRGCLPLPALGDAGVTGDAGPIPCPMTGCTDNNPCTDDSCVGGTCAFMPNSTGQCDDGLYCNGSPDHCSAGACSMHPGNPCTTTCDEAQHTCICGSTADCPAEVDGAWSDCAFADGCAISGTQSRSVTTYTCGGSGSCIPSTTTQMQACTRASTDGMSCGTTTCDGFGGCSYGDACALGGSQSQSCTDYVCSSGSCGARGRTEYQSCGGRSTDGNSCGATTCGGWSGCDFGGDTCAQDGTQSHHCTDMVCSGGSCGSVGYNDTRGCSRSTDGDLCGFNPTICGNPTNCHICSGGSCVTNSGGFNDSCQPSCGVAISLCGGPGTCCNGSWSCSQVYGGGTSDCDYCCDANFCY